MKAVAFFGIFFAFIVNTPITGIDWTVPSSQYLVDLVPHEKIG